MPKRLLALAVLAAVVGPLAGGVAMADHCNGQVRTIGGTLYIDNRGTADGNIWVYLESNGEAGLQSGGTHEVLGYSDDCAHDNPDTLLY